VKQVAIVLAVAMSIVACSVGGATHEHVVMPVRVQSETQTCSSPFVKPELASLKACGEGKGHCYDKAKVPITGLPACEGDQVCVPDKVLDINGGKLKACTFFIGQKPGVCFSNLVEDVAKHINELQKDVCDEDERCIPCIDPTNGEDTHSCEAMGVHEKACVGGVGAKVESCCHGAGACISPDAVPEDQRGDLSQEVCPRGKLCSPAAMVDGNPVQCDVLGVSGVCLDTCFANMLRPAGKLMRAGCGPTEVCLPCIIGKGQGMPGCE
jgi:hypothetical protein